MATCASIVIVQSTRYVKEQETTEVRELRIQFPVKALFKAGFDSTPESLAMEDLLKPLVKSWPTVLAKCR